MSFSRWVICFYKMKILFYFCYYWRVDSCLSASFRWVELFTWWRDGMLLRLRGTVWRWREVWIELAIERRSRVEWVLFINVKIYDFNTIGIILVNGSNTERNQEEKHKHLKFSTESKKYQVYWHFSLPFLKYVFFSSYQPFLLY